MPSRLLCFTYNNREEQNEKGTKMEQEKGKRKKTATSATCMSGLLKSSPSNSYGRQYISAVSCVYIVSCSTAINSLMSG